MSASPETRKAWSFHHPSSLNGGKNTAIHLHDHCLNQIGMKKNLLFTVILIDKNHEKEIP